MEAIKNRFYNATVDFSDYAYDAKAVDCIVFKEDEHFRVLSSSGKADFHGFLMSADYVTVNEEISTWIEFENYEGVTVVYKSETHGLIRGTIEQHGHYQSLIRPDGYDEPAVWIDDWKYSIADSEIHGKRAVIINGEAKYVTCTVYKNCGEYRFEAFSRDDKDTSYVTIGDVVILPDIHRWDVVTVKPYTELAREFQPDYLAQLIYDYMPPYNEIYKVMDGVSKMKIVDPEGNVHYVNKNILRRINRSTLAYSSKLCQQNDIVTYRNSEGTVVAKHKNYALCYFENMDNISSAGFSYGTKLDPNHLAWVSCVSMDFVRRGTEEKLETPSLATALTNAVASFKAATHTFEVGEQITIRSLEDMKTVFGENDNGEPKTKVRFTSAMYHLCGRTATIRSINGSRITLENWSDPENTNFIFSTEFVVGGDTVPEIKRTELEKAIGNVKIGDNSDFWDIELPAISYMLTTSGEFWQIISDGTTKYCQRGNDLYVLSKRLFSENDILCILGADNSGQLPINISSRKAIWTNKVRLSPKDIEILTGIKVVEE